MNWYESIFETPMYNMFVCFTYICMYVCIHIDDDIENELILEVILTGLVVHLIFGNIQFTHNRLVRLFASTIHVSRSMANVRMPFTILATSK